MNDSFLNFTPHAESEDTWIEAYPLADPVRITRFVLFLQQVVETESVDIELQAGGQYRLHVAAPPSRVVEMILRFAGPALAEIRLSAAGHLRVRLAAGTGPSLTIATPLSAGGDSETPPAPSIAAGPRAVGAETPEGPAGLAVADVAESGIATPGDPEVPHMAAGSEAPIPSSPPHGAPDGVADLVGAEAVTQPSTLPPESSARSDRAEEPAAADSSGDVDGIDEAAADTGPTGSEGSRSGSSLEEQSLLELSAAAAPVHREADTAAVLAETDPHLNDAGRKQEINAGLSCGSLAAGSIASESEGSEASYSDLATVLESVGGTTTTVKGHGQDQSTVEKVNIADLLAIVEDAGSEPVPTVEEFMAAERGATIAPTSDTEAPIDEVSIDEARSASEMAEKEETCEVTDAVAVGITAQPSAAAAQNATSAPDAEHALGVVAGATVVDAADRPAERPPREWAATPDAALSWSAEAPVLGPSLRDQVVADSGPEAARQAEAAGAIADPVGMAESSAHEPTTAPQGELLLVGDAVSSSSRPPGSATELNDASGALTWDAFVTVATVSIQQAKQRGQPLALVLVALDESRDFAQSIGPGSESTALGLISSIVLHVVGDGGIVGRHGPRSLAVLANEGGPAAAWALGEQVRVEVEKYVLKMDAPMPFSVSVGISTTPQAGMSLGELVNAAEDALIETAAHCSNRTQLSPASAVATGPTGEPLESQYMDPVPSLDRAERAKRRQTVLARATDAFDRGEIEGVAIQTSVLPCPVCRGVAQWLYVPHWAPQLPISGCTARDDCHCLYRMPPIDVRRRPPPVPAITHEKIEIPQVLRSAALFGPGSKGSASVEDVAQYLDSYPLLPFEANLDAEQGEVVYLTREARFGWEENLRAGAVMRGFAYPSKQEFLPWVRLLGKLPAYSDKALSKKTKGVIYLTNWRICFGNDRDSRSAGLDSVLLADVAEVECFRDGIALTITGRNNRLMLLVRDPLQVGLCFARALRDIALLEH